MKSIATVIALLVFAGSAHAQCYKEIRKPQKPRDVARLKWTAAGRTWDAVLVWETLAVSDNGDETAGAGVGVFDNRRVRTMGDSRNYDLTPNRCDEQIDPQLSTVKLMGRDFLLVTVPQGGTHGSAVVAWMYSIDEKGHLTQVFHSALRGHHMSGSECRNLLRSSIRADNADGSRISWVYEYPDVEWVKKKSDCAKAKIDRDTFPYEWKNGCFPAMDAPKASADRLITNWDDDECVTGKGLVIKGASLDGGAPRPAPSRAGGTQ